MFRKMHEQDEMAKDKLAEGIEGFTKAMVQLEKLLSERLDKLETQPTISS
jgi:transaldolase